jgi:hypothetical protein
VLIFIKDRGINNMGIEFRNVKSTDLGLIVKTVSLELLPKAKTSIQSALNRDGSYDFSNVNEDGRIHYEDRVFQFKISLIRNTRVNIQKAFSKMIGWLYGDFGPLELDDMPNIIWVAKLENAEKISQEFIHAGEANIYFRVKPFAKSTVNTYSNVKLNSNLLLGSNYKIGGVIKDYTYSIGTSTKLNINNIGTWYTKPRFKVTGTYTYVEIKNKYNKSFKYFGGSVENIIDIDFDTNFITKDNIPINDKAIGLGWEFTSGINETTFLTDGVNVKVMLYMDYYYLFGEVEV